MFINLKTAAVAAVLLGASALGAGSASAMPAGGLDPAIATGSDLAPLVQDVRWVCGPYGHCRWVAPPRYYGPPRFHGPRVYGPRRHWRRW
jgi:hypothetical protein